MAEFQITLVVTPVIPDEGFLVFADPPSQAVVQGVVAEFLISLSGDYTGLVDLTVEGVPEGAVAEFDASQIMVSETAILTIATADVTPGEFPMVVKALAAA